MDYLTRIHSKSIQQSAKLLNILLQVMDYGQLTDSNGRKADFRHVIIIMTTNAGAENLEREMIGFVNHSNRPENMGAIKRYFSPEFRNRLDGIIAFSYLDQSILGKIVDKFLDGLRTQLKEKEIGLTVSATAKHWLARHGYSQKMGARPMARLIQEQLKLPLADEILRGNLQAGDHVRITVGKGALRIKCVVTA